MKDATLQRKLNQLATLANELGEEAKRRFGDKAELFFESDGTFHIMSGDSDGGASERLAFVEFSSNVYCTMGSGAW